MCGIYCWRNLVNNNCYIGLSNNIQKRFLQHIKGDRSAKLLQAAFKKYGILNFEFSILEECKEIDLPEREKFWIKELNTIAPNGYNLTEGGTGGNTFQYLTETELSEVGKKISDALVECNASGKRVYSDETRAAMSIKHSGEGNPRYGKKDSAETREKKRISHLGKKHPGYVMPEEKKELRRDRTHINKDGVGLCVKDNELQKYLDEGWQIGQINDPNKKKTTGYVFINNGIKNKSVPLSELNSYLSNGYVKSMLRKKAKGSSTIESIDNEKNIIE